MTWYHLSFFAVSLAMLGMAGGAVHVFVGGDRYRGENARRALPRVALALAAAIPASHLANLVLPIPDLSAVVLRVTALDVASIALSTAVLTVPFALAGVAITLGLTRVGGPIGALYGADLLGAAAGALLVIPLLEWTNLSSGVFAAGAAAAGGALCFARAFGASRQRAPRVILAALLLAAAGNATTDRGVGVLRAKGVDVRPERGERAVWNSHSFVFVGLPFPNRPPWYWGRGEGADAQRVTWAGINIDGAASSPLTRWDGDVSSLDWVRYDVTSLPYHLRRGHAGIIGVGGGRDVLAALGLGSERVTGIEVNGTFLDLLRGPFRDFAGIADRDDVRLVHAEARSYLARSHERFDVLQMSLIDTWAATGAGAFTLTENGLYTREAWGIFLDRLAPGGIFSVSRFFDPDNVSETTRLVALAVAALLDRGVTDPAAHLALVAREVVATLLVSPQPLSDADVDRISEVADRYGFDVLLLPGREAASPQLGAIAASDSEDALRRASAHPDYDFRPPTDDRPYFFNLLKLSSFAKVRDVSLGVVAGNLRATATLLALLALSSVLVVLILGWPLLRAGAPAMGLATLGFALWYFAALGAGFMSVQIPFLQRFSVYLGHPALSYAVILSSMIAFAGLGSFASEGVAVERPTWRRALPASIALSALGVALLLPALLRETMAWPTAARCALVVAVVAPLSTLLGFCFPLGMRLVERLAPDATAWMWGANGACGVLASIVAVAVSLRFGIDANFAVAAALYASLAIPAAALARRVAW